MFDTQYSYYDLMKELNPEVRNKSKGSVPLTREIHCHIDPDIIKRVLHRDPEWRGLFGQVKAAQTHLDNMKVEIDDVFLFFGWFRRTNRRDGKVTFDMRAPNQHIIFGYLQIGEIIKRPSKENCASWMHYHPHLQYTNTTKTNTLYVARKNLSWNNRCSGWGVFDFENDLVLTKDGYTRSKWGLPEIFRNGEVMSYHNKKSWKDEGYFQSAYTGQEFVVNSTQEIEEWTKRLIDKHCAR